MLQQSRERVLDCWTSAMLWWLRIAGSRMEKRVAEQADQHVWHDSDERLLKIAAVQRQTEHKEGNGGVK